MSGGSTSYLTLDREPTKQNKKTKTKNYLANVELKCPRCSVLRELQYVDGCSVVQLKGRVACEMGSNELIITELVFMNQVRRPPSTIIHLHSPLHTNTKRLSSQPKHLPFRL